MEHNENAIIVFGFSGSGKSTLANYIARIFDLRVIHPSSLLRDIARGKEPNINSTIYGKGFWESPQGIALFKSRLHEKEPIDVTVGKILVEELSRGNIVIDSWSLPWLTTQGIRIYLKAPTEIRAERIAKQRRITYAYTLEVVRMKDRETRNLFKRITDSISKEITKECSI